MVPVGGSIGENADSGRLGVLLVGLGTPRQPTEESIRAFLDSFLSDQRVVDYPRWFWLPILRGVILRRRPRKLVAPYRILADDAGVQPLEIELLRLRQSLQEAFSRLDGAFAQERAGAIHVEAALRYVGDRDPGASPSSIAEGLRKLALSGSLGKGEARSGNHGVTRIVVLPLFPHYSETTSGSVIAEVERVVGQDQALQAWASANSPKPRISVVREYHDHPAWISAVASTIQGAKKLWKERSAPHVLFCFHGVPKRYVTDTDPYDRACEKSASGIAAACGMDKDDWSVAYQSRFGPERWLEPSAEAEAQRLARSGKTSLLVVSPGFFSDCIETTIELDDELRNEFLRVGGQAFGTVPCLNGGQLAAETTGRILLAGWNATGVIPKWTPVST